MAWMHGDHGTKHGTEAHATIEFVLLVRTEIKDFLGGNWKEIF